MGGHVVPLVHSTINTDRETQALTVTLASKLSARTYIHTMHSLWIPTKLRHARAPEPSEYDYKS